MPFMVVLYFLGCIAVLGIELRAYSRVLRADFSRRVFFTGRFTGAFLGGTVGYAFIFGMKRALFSSEAGQGSSPIAHSAARTDEPVREGIVAALEPFIDTLVVCTLTALVILSTGQWRRGPEAEFADATTRRSGEKSRVRGRLEKPPRPNVPEAAGWAVNPCSWWQWRTTGRKRITICTRS